MSESPHVTVSPLQGLAGRLLHAALALELSTQLALVCCFFGWFFMSTLVVSLGALEHGVRFYDLAAVIGDPARLFFGVDGTFQRFAFGSLCMLCLLVPLSPHVVRLRTAWLAYLVPLGLMVLCAVLLYVKNSGELFPMSHDSQLLSAPVLQLANRLVHRGAAVVSQHVALGAGAYLSLIGSLVLAFQGITRFRQLRAPR